MVKWTVRTGQMLDALQQYMFGVCGEAQQCAEPVT